MRLFRQITAHEARRELRDAEMRRKLLEFLYEQTSDLEHPARPIKPMLDDDQVQKELNRILKK